ncbi:MAG: PilT/PilU family type 4a pilus ATPase, partial [Verrucomicrobiota bacterium]
TWEELECEVGLASASASLQREFKHIVKKKVTLPAPGQSLRSEMEAAGFKGSTLIDRVVRETGGRMVELQRATREDLQVELMSGIKPLQAARFWRWLTPAVTDEESIESDTELVPIWNWEYAFNSARKELMDEIQFKRWFDKNMRSILGATRITSEGVVHGFGTVATKRLEPGMQLWDPTAVTCDWNEIKKLGLDNTDTYIALGNSSACFRLQTPDRMWSSRSYYLNEARGNRISDFHIKVGEVIRFRLDNALQKVPDSQPLRPEQVEALIIPLLNDQAIASLKADPMADIDSSYSLALPHGVFRFRINVFHDVHGLAAAIRLLPPRIPPITRVGFHNDKVWRRLIELNQGLVIVAGIAGSGKSTTIASLLDAILSTRSVRLISLEDPIEYRLKSYNSLVSQREVGMHVHNYENGLRSSLREDPDIIYLGEIRDLETAMLAMTAAETGHLVFTTLHTRDAIGAITRLMDMFPVEREKEVATQLSFSLRSVISQKLIPRTDGQGRIMAMEVLTNSSAVANGIRRGELANLYSTMETKAELGMNTMEQRLVEMQRQGLISREQAISHANREEIIERLPLA